MDADRHRRGPTRPSAVFVLVFLGALLVVFGAATLPPMTHHSPQGLVLPAPDIPDPAQQTRTAEPSGDPVAPEHRPDDAAIGRIGQTLAAVLFAVVVLFVVGMVVSLRRQARAEDPPEVPDAEDIPSDAKLRAEVAATLARAETSLAEATGALAGSRLIACWAELEALAAARGLRHDRASTPTEQAGAMLVAFGVPSAPLARLLALYERARYDVGVPGWEPDTTQVRQAASDFAQLAETVGASGRVHRRTGAGA